MSDLAELLQKHAVISLSELVQKRTGWPEEIYPVLSHNGDERCWFGRFDHSDNEHGEDGYLSCHSDENDSADLLGEMLSAEHNAMPVLVAIARAAKIFTDWQEQLGPGDFAADKFQDLMQALSKVKP